MLHEVVSDPGERDVEDLHRRYLSEVADAIEVVGAETVVRETGIDEETVRAVQAGEAPELTVEEAVAVLATRPDAPLAADGAARARDALLMGMTNAVMDVESVAAAVDGALEPREIQSKVEGRYPMTLREYALLSHHIARNGP